MDPILSSVLQGLTILLLLTIGLGIVIILSIWRNDTKIDVKGNLAKKSPLNEVQRLIYGQLVRAFPEYLIFPQLCFGRFLHVEGKDKSSRFWLGKLKHRVADYVICNQHAQVICVIQLEHKSLTTYREQEMDAALAQIGLTIYRLPVTHHLSSEELKTAILTAVQQANVLQKPLAPQISSQSPPNPMKWEDKGWW